MSIHTRRTYYMFYPANKIPPTFPPSREQESFQVQEKRRAAGQVLRTPELLMMNSLKHGEVCVCVVSFPFYPYTPHTHSPICLGGTHIPLPLMSHTPSREPRVRTFIKHITQLDRTKPKRLFYLRRPTPQSIPATRLRYTRMLCNVEAPMPLLPLKKQHPQLGGDLEAKGQGSRKKSSSGRTSLGGGSAGSSVAATASASSGRKESSRGSSR